MVICVVAMAMNVVVVIHVVLVVVYTCIYMLWKEQVSSPDLTKMVVNFVKWSHYSAMDHNSLRPNQVPFSVFCEWFRRKCLCAYIALSLSPSLYIPFSICL